MKQLVAIGATTVCALIAAVIFLWPVQRTGAEAIVYGRDACARCRMHMSRPGFAGEIRDRNGTLTKYDDIGCMLQAMVALHREIPEAWVEDHNGGGFVSLLNATLVHANKLETPMGYGIVAFQNANAAHAFEQSQHGEVLTLEEVLNNSSRLLARNSGASSFDQR